MAEKKKQIIFKDYLFEFSKGVNSGVAPILIPKNQLSFAINATVRSTFATHRPVLRKIPLNFQGDDTAQAVFESQGLWQGGAFFKSEYGFQSLTAQVGGRLFNITFDTNGNGLVTDVSIPGDLNNSGLPIAWFWQAERWMIIQNGEQLPMFFDGQTTRRSFGPSKQLGCVTADFVVPPLGQSVNITLAAPYTGPTNQVIFIDDVFYQVNSSGAGYKITLQNMTESAGHTVPAGKPVIIPSNFIGLTKNTTVPATICCPRAQQYGMYFQNPPIDFHYTAPSGNQVSIRVPDAGDVYATYPVQAADKAAGLLITTFQFTPGPSLPVLPALTAAYAGYFSAASTISTLQSSFVTPPVGGTVDAVIGVPYNGALGQLVVINGGVYEIIATNNTPVLSPNVNVTNINDANFTPAVPARGPSTPATPGCLHTVPEINAGRMGAYGLGRNWYSLPDGRSYRATDLVGSSSGSPALKSRDAVLRETQNTFLTSGDFVIPGNVGDIQSMTFMAQLDTSLGQGPLAIGTPTIIFSCNAPVDETTWQNLNNPIQTESLKGQGPVNHYGTINTNSDLMFRSRIGWASEILAKREFYTWGNTSISEELKRVVRQDNKSLLGFGSSVDFDNRFISTSKPIQSQAGVFHQGSIALNFDPVSSLAGKAPSVYDGLWEGVNVLLWVTGEFNGEPRAFAFSYNTVANKIELYELLSDDPDDRDHTHTVDFDGIDEVPISWSLETAVLFREVKNKDPDDLCRLEAGIFFLADVTGRVDYQIFYRPQFHPCWIPWDSGFVCADATGQKQNKAPIGIRSPSADDCDPSNNRPYKISESFQFKFVFTGSCRFYGARFFASAFDQPEFVQPQCNPDCPILDCVPDNDYGLYNLQNRSLSPPATPFKNESVFFTHACPDGDILKFTGSLPFWVTFNSSIGLIGKSGVFSGVTQAEADAAAQAQIDAIGNAALSAATLTCGPAGPSIVLVNAQTTGWGAEAAIGFVENAGTFYGIGGTKFYSSVDGINWTSVASHGLNGPSGLAFGAGLFVASDNSGVPANRVFSSPTGAVWTAHVAGGVNFAEGVAFGAGIFVIAGDGSQAATSPDGLAWTSRTIGGGTVHSRSVAFGAGVFVAVGEDTAVGVIYSSANGIAWTNRVTAGGRLSSVSFSDGLFVAVGNGSVVYTSPDGITWTLRAAVGGTLRACGGGGGLHVLGDFNGDVYTSPDGITWTLLETEPSGRVPSQQGVGYYSTANVIDVGFFP